MTKKAIILYGVESTGTRIFTKLFVDGGVFGDYTHSQRLDKLLKTKGEIPADVDYVIIRRSFPHDGQWDDIGAMIDRLELNGFTDIRLVIPTRDWGSNIASKKITHHREPAPFNRESPREDIIRASYLKLFREIIKSNVPFYIFTYEMLIHEPEEFKRWLHVNFKLPKLPDTEIKNANRKYITGNIKECETYKRNCLEPKEE